MRQRQTSSFQERFRYALLNNALHFPVINILLEWLVISHNAYFLRADPYVLLGGAVAQALVLAATVDRRPAWAFWGNLVGVGLYTLFEMMVEGMEFWQAPHHVLYWAYSLTIAGLAYWQARWPNDAAIFGAYLVRALALLAAYVVGERYVQAGASFAVALEDPTHIFMLIAVPLLGVLGGIAEVSAERYQRLLDATNRRLHTYARWLLGDGLLQALLNDPDAGTPKRRDRAVLFADVRQFTAWSEDHTPEVVMQALQTWYHAVESLLQAHSPVRYKFTADEVMVVFRDATTAAHAALRLRDVSEQVWQPHGLSVGVGLHVGPVVEGLIGGQEVKQYDVVGDTVNTAQRIEKSAPAGQVLISDEVYRRLPSGFIASAPFTVEAKHKPNLRVRLLRSYAEPEPLETPQNVLQEVFT